MNATDREQPLRVLFLCTHNSARSQMAEALLAQIGGERFEVTSAGTEATRVHPLAVRAMAEVGIDISDVRSKHLDEYLGQGFDYVITVCDRARAACPVFPGGAETLHWDIDDPAEVNGTDVERRAAFERAMLELSRRIHTFLPLALAERRAVSSGED